MAPRFDAILHNPERYQLGTVRIPENLYPAFDGWIDGMLNGYCKVASVSKLVHRVEFSDLREPTPQQKSANKSAAKPTSRMRQCRLVTQLKVEHVHAALCRTIMEMLHDGTLTVHHSGDSRALSFAVTLFTDDPKVHLYVDTNIFFVDYDLIEECNTALAVAAK